MLNVNFECQCRMAIWDNKLVACGCPGGPYGCLWTPYGCSETTFGCPWGCIWLLRGSISLPMGSVWLLRSCIWVPLGLHMASQRLHMGLHMAVQRLHLAAEGLHFAAQGPSMAPMRQICSICCIWLGRAGQPGSREDGQVMVNGLSWAPNHRQQWRSKPAECIIQGSRMKYAQGLKAADGKMVT